MGKLKHFIKQEITGWKKLEIFWLLAACTVITALSIYWGDTLMGIISSTTGVACVVCTGKGKLSAYTFGLINCVLYAINFPLPVQTTQATPVVELIIPIRVSPQ